VDTPKRLHRTGTDLPQNPAASSCKSLNAIRSLQNSLSRRDGKATSILNSGECSIASNEVVVYIMHEEKDMARVLLPGSGKYLWISKQSLR
jgi:hypothetical protein